MLEATVLLIDSSEYMRNGDYTPSRWGAQKDAVNMLFSRKTGENPENTVGLVAMGGDRPTVLVTLTKDIGKILSAMHKTEMTGKLHFSTAIQVAVLALKHRENKSQKQRIIAFAGSPVDDNVDDLIGLGKRLKKNGVAVDVINFGEHVENLVKLEAFVDAVNSSENSHLVTIPQGPLLFSDQILSCPILEGSDNFEFGVDPGMDPELALALRMSLEEERARQARVQVQESS